MERIFNRRDLIRGAVELAKGGTLFWLFSNCVSSSPEPEKFAPSPKLKFVEVPLLGTEDALIANIQKEGIDLNRLNNFKAKLVPLIREKTDLFDKDLRQAHLWIVQGEKDSSAILASGTSAWFIRGERESRLEKVSGRVINTEDLALNPPRSMRTAGLTVNSGFDQYGYGTVYDEFVDRSGWTIYRKKPHESHESSLSRMEIVRTGEEVPVINLGSHYVEVKMPTPLPGLFVDMDADWINFSFLFYHTKEQKVDEVYGKWDALYGKWLNGPKKNMPLFRLPNILSQQTARFIKVSLDEYRNSSGMPAEIIENGGWIKGFDFALNHSGLFFALPPRREAIFPTLQLLDGIVTETKQASDNTNYVEIRSSMDSRTPIRFFFPRTGEFLVRKGQAIQLGTPLFRITNIPGHPYQLGFEKDFRAMEGEVAFMMSVTPFGYAAGEWRTIGNIGFGWPETEKGEYILIPTRSRSR